MNRHGFTLVEMVVALSITTVLVVAMGSALTFAGRATPQPNDAMTVSLAAHDVLSDLAAELSYGIDITDRTATAITFTIADQTGDDTPETIRYEWTGDAMTPGPITRSENGGVPATLFDDATDFALSYDIHTESRTVPGPPTVGAEVQLSAFSGTIGLADHGITDQQWSAQTFSLSAPTDATGVSITRVLLRARTSGTVTDAALVQIQSADGTGRPSGALRVQAVLNESVLTGVYGWFEVAMDSDAVLPIEDLCLVVRHLDGDVAGTFRGATAAGAMWQTFDGGGSWSAVPLTHLEHEVYGRYHTPGTDVVVTTDRCVAVTLTLQADVATRGQQSVALRNRPEVIP